LNIDICIQNAVISIQILLIFKKSSPLKLLGEINRNLVGSIYGRSSVNIAHFVPFLPSFGSFRQAVSEEKILKISNICIEITAF
jgi:hypothetical protein